MDYTLLAMVLIAIGLVLIMWYYSSDHYTDGIKVDLSGSEDKLVADWYSKQGVDVEIEEISDEILASMILSELYDVDAEPHTLVFGENLGPKYAKLTGKQLVLNTTLFNLRDLLALPYDIAIIRNGKVRAALLDQSCDLTQLRTVIHNRWHEQVTPYLKKVLEHRWNKLMELGDERFINNSGSYVLVRSDKEQVLHNIIGHRINDVIRLNLLCSDHEFGLLLKRWRRYMKNLLPQTF